MILQNKIPTKQHHPSQPHTIPLPQSINIQDDSPTHLLLLRVEDGCQQCDQWLVCSHSIPAAWNDQSLPMESSIWHSWTRVWSGMSWMEVYGAELAAIRTSWQPQQTRSRMCSSKCSSGSACLTTPPPLSTSNIWTVE